MRASSHLLPRAGMPSGIGQTLDISITPDTTQPSVAQERAYARAGRSVLPARESFSMARSAASPQLRGRSASPKSRSTPTGAGTTQWGRSVAETYDDASVLHIADRPSVALAIAEALSSGNRRTRGHGLLKVHDCFGHFPPAGNKSCSFAITSVCGHLQSLELVAPIGEPRERDLRELFGAKMRRVAEPASERVGVREHLARESHGRGWVCFWTSCDLEGESIIFEVLRCLPRFTPDRVWRARFSSIAPAALQRSLRRLVKPDPTGAAAVDARLELELKTYLAFSRLLTRALRQAVREALSLPRVRTLTYGMGHIAALGLCVTRKREVRLHRPTPFYDIRATVTILAPKETKETAKRSKGGPSFARPKSPRKGGASGGDMPAELKARLEAAVEAAAAAESSASVVEALAANQARELYLQDVLKKAPYWARTADGAVLGTAASGAELTRKGQTVPDRTIEMQWCGGPTHSKVQAEKMMSLFKHGSNRTGSKPELLVLSVAHEERRLPPPAGLSELGLLRIGADYLCLSGERTLAVAEELYARGLITYPRTHSTKYPSNLDVVGTLSLLAMEQTDFAPLARWLLLAPPPVPRRGEASGEHPPILPVGRVSRKEVETSCGMHGWHVYEAVCVHFLASLFPDAVYQEKRLQAKLDNASHTFEFATTWHKILDHGWMHAQPWRLKDLGMKLEGIEPELDAYLPGDTIQNVQIDLTVGFTPPPKPFTEAELYSLLHANGVGTDGSLPQHLGAAVRSGYLEIRSAGGRVIGDVGNGEDRGAGAGSERATALAADAAIEVTGEPAGSADATPDPMMTLTARKGYVRPPLLPGRYVVPTRLGIAIYDGLAHCDRELVAPSLRATLEKQVAYIATLPPPAAVGDTASSVIAKDVVNAALEALAGRFDTCRARLDGFRSLLKQRPLASTAAETEVGENELINMHALAAICRLPPPECRALTAAADAKRHRDLTRLAMTHGVEAARRSTHQLGAPAPTPAPAPAPATKRLQMGGEQPTAKMGEPTAVDGGVTVNGKPTAVDHHPYESEEHMPPPPLPPPPIEVINEEHQVYARFAPSPRSVRSTPCASVDLNGWHPNCALLGTASGTLPGVVAGRLAQTPAKAGSVTPRASSPPPPSPRASGASNAHDGAPRPTTPRQTSSTSGNCGAVDGAPEIFSRCMSSSFALPSAVEKPSGRSLPQPQERKLVRDVGDGAASKCESTAKSEAAQATSRTPRAHASSGHIPSPLRHGSPAAEVRETAGCVTVAGDVYFVEEEAEARRGLAKALYASDSASDAQPLRLSLALLSVSGRVAPPGVPTTAPPGVPSSPRAASPSTPRTNTPRGTALYASENTPRAALASPRAALASPRREGLGSPRPISPSRVASARDVAAAAGRASAVEWGRAEASYAHGAPLGMYAGEGALPPGSPLNPAAAAAAAVAAADEPTPEMLAAEAWALVSVEERAARLAAQTRLRQMLTHPEGRTKLLLHPKTLPTAPYAGKCLCPWENIGLPCPTTEREHFFRHCHRVCAYCYVSGHALAQCSLAERDGLPIGSALLKHSARPATPPHTPRGGPRSTS